MAESTILVALRVERVMEKLKDLKVDKAGGGDGVYSRVLKETSAQLAKPLKLLHAKSFPQGNLPYDRKKTVITPILRKDRET